MVERLKRFNPFMPKAGVGSFEIYSQSVRLKRVSIHLCPKQALEAEEGVSLSLQEKRFNPFMPKAGVGSF